MKLFLRGWMAVQVLAVAFLVAGCHTSDPYKFDPLKGDGAPAQSATSQAFPVSASNAAAPTNKAPVMADPTSTLLYVGNTLTISFSDTPTTIPPIDDVIKEDGSITLLYNQKFQAAGKTVGALQSEIRDRYVPQYFRYLTVSIKTADRYFSVGGEVRSPGRQVYTGRMTVLGAIDTGGGFGDFGDHKHVLLTRLNGQKFVVNCKKALDHPELNLEVFPGDQVFVKKRW